MRVPWVVESLGVPFVFFHVYYPEYVQDVVTKTIPKKKKCKKARWLSKEALQKAEKKKRS